MDQPEDKDTALMHDFTDGLKKSMLTPRLLILLFIVTLLGVGTGYFLVTGSGSGLAGVGDKLKAGSLSKGKVVGSDDLKTYKDVTEGILKEGGLEGEGQYHLERPGGPSQNVYLTSFIVDLSEFLNKKIKVWGQTQKAQKVGWLMDVGRVEVL